MSHSHGRRRAFTAMKQKEEEYSVYEAYRRKLCRPSERTILYCPLDRTSTAYLLEEPSAVFYGTRAAVQPDAKEGKVIESLHYRIPLGRERQGPVPGGPGSAT